MSKRTYRPGIVQTLFTYSRGYCYWPSCPEPVTRFVEDEPVLNVMIAHICALEAGGPRYDPNMTPEERNVFSNVLLLCKPHHTVVDRASTVSTKYPVHLLRAWKTTREHGMDLEGLGRVTQADLEEMIHDVVEEARDEIMTAIAKVARGNEEIADMLYLLVEERFTQPRIDPDAVAALRTAARVFATLPDDATLMYEAAKKLKGMGEWVATLSNLAPRLERTANRLGERY